MEAKDKIIKSRINLISCNGFFGRLVMLLKPVENRDIWFMATDGERLLYNPDEVLKHDDNVIQSIIIHEVLHVALSHINRKKDRVHTIWNIATDYAINLIVLDTTFNKKSINGGIVREQRRLPDGVLIDEKYRGWTADAIYNNLIKNAETVTVIKNGTTIQEERVGSDAVEKSNQSHEEWGKQDENKRKETEIRWKKAVKQAYDVERSRGSVPSIFDEIIEDMSPEENWRALLAMYLSEDMTDYDFTKKDRRFLRSKFFLPDMKSVDTLKDVVVAIDTSGSISTDELNMFVSEIYGIISTFPNVNGYVIECDASVKNFYEMSGRTEIKKVSGRGGTSHKPVFSKVEAENLNPKVMLCFTDLATIFPEQPPTYPVLWIATPQTENTDVPFGRVVKLKENLVKSNAKC